MPHVYKLLTGVAICMSTALGFVYMPKLCAAQGAALFNKIVPVTTEPVKISPVTMIFPPPPPPPPPKPKVMGVFTGIEFRNLYENFASPNTQKTTSPPPITGDEIADQRIRDLAINRGYTLRSVATASLVTIDGFLLQSPAAQAWQEMKTRALAEGIGLRLAYGYRSFAQAQTMFVNKLTAAGITPQMIEAGTADATINTILQTVTIPGYSKHHSGYTVDIGCSTGGTFANTPCFNWLNKNNYANAKKFGWIPSYPDGGGAQGPNPEPWEYVWVGVDTLMRTQ